MQPCAFDAGNLALDLLNTSRGGGSQAEDVVSSPDAILTWLTAAGLVTDDQLRRLRCSPPDTKVLLAEAQRLRLEIRRIVDAIKGGRLAPETSLMTLNRVLEARRTSRRLARQEGGLALVEVTEEGPIHSLLSPVAEAAAHLIVAGDPARIRQCHAEDCQSWFVDTSKNGRRKWCSMLRCGNRAKVAAHYRRHRRS